ncbi:sialin-like [Cochliomyia hominivorax]
MKNVKCRTILWHLVFWGFIINYMFCINLNITIVDMIVKKSVPDVQKMDYTISNVTKRSVELNNSITNRTEPNSHNKKFDWNEYQQGLILGSFFWLYWLTQIPGGILAKKYGTKLIFGLSNVICSWLCFFIPMASYYNYKILITLRIVQGAIAGFTWPAMHVLTAKWIPPDERSKFVTAYFGSSIGVAFSYPLFAYIMHYMTWERVYDICGIVGTIWWLGWLFLVYDSPVQHPRITISELRYIEKSLGSTVQQHNNKSVKIPWKEIFTSRPVWMNVMGQWAGVWGLFTLMTQSPTYFKVVHNWDIRSTGILSGIPHILRMIFAYTFSLYADYLLRSNKMERTALRKFATSICAIGMGLVVLVLAYLGRDPIWAVVLISLATMLQGAGSSGPLSSMIDIAPNYAGIVCGICGTIGNIPGFISAYLVGILTMDNQTFEAWTYVFLICAAMLIGCGVLYVIFADSRVQKWNNYNRADVDKDSYLLNNNNEKKTEYGIGT